MHSFQWKHHQSTAEIDDKEDAANNREYDTENENHDSKAYTYQRGRRRGGREGNCPPTFESWGADPPRRGVLCTPPS